MTEADPRYTGVEWNSGGAGKVCSHVGQPRRRSAPHGSLFGELRNLVRT